MVRSQNFLLHPYHPPNRTFHLHVPFFSRYEQPDLDGLGGLGDRDFEEGKEGTRDPRGVYVYILNIYLDVHNLLMGLVTYLHRGYNPATKYHGHPSTQGGFQK